MTAVTARAAAPARPAVRDGDLRGPALLTMGATVLALVLTVRAPIATAVLGLALIGLLHNILELRYVLGRFAGVLAGRFLGLMAVLISGVVLCRLLPAGPGARAGEIVLGYVVVALAWLQPGKRLPAWGVAAGLVVGCAAAATSLAFPAYHFVVLAHLHNVVPLFFLWEWSSGGTRVRRQLFRTATLTWVAVVPALLLAGAFDRWLRVEPATLAGFGGGSGFAPARMAALYTPPAWLDSALAGRFLVLFAFGQTMHYVVWVLLLPRYAPRATAAFERRVPALRGPAVWLLGLAGAAALGIVFAQDWTAGRSLYAVLTTYHVYLEFPVLLALLLGLPAVAQVTGEASPLIKEETHAA